MSPYKYRHIHDITCYVILFRKIMFTRLGSLKRTFIEQGKTTERSGMFSYSFDLFVHFHFIFTKDVVCSVRFSNKQLVTFVVQRLKFHISESQL